MKTRQITRKIISALLVLLLCLTLLPLGVLADEESEDTMEVAETAEMAETSEAEEITDSIDLDEAPDAAEPVETADTEEPEAEADASDDCSDIVSEDEIVSEDDIVGAETDVSANVTQSELSALTTTGGLSTVSTDIAVAATSDTSGAKDAIIAGISNWSEEIDLSDYNISVNDVMNLYQSVLDDNPELFYVTGTVSYSYNKINDVPAYVVTLKPTYNSNYTKSDVAVFEEAISSAMAEALPNTSGMSEYQIALALHDYIALHASYDFTTTYRDAYSILVDGTGVCEAYSAAYAAMLKRVGIEVSYAESTAMGHKWNLVKIDGNWYHVDVTWDDAVGNTTGKVDHYFFLNSDSQIKVDAAGSGYLHYGWTTSNGVSCTSTKYDNAYWQTKDVSAIYCIGGTEYYLDLSNSDGTNTVSLIKRTGSTETTLYSFTGKWYVWGSDTTYMTSLYSTLSYYNGLLYFNDPLHVYSISPTNTSTVNTVYTYTGGQGYIYGFMVWKDGLTVELRQAYNEVYSIFKVTDLNGDNTSSGYDLGDVNGDGIVDIKDARTLFQYVNKELSASDVITDVMDVDGDGDVNAKDVRTLFQYANKQIDVLTA